MRWRTRPVAALVLAAVVLAACSDDEQVYVERPVEELYNEAVDQVTVEDYAAASDLFLEVERQHPYSIWATTYHWLPGKVWPSTAAFSRASGSMPIAV